MHYGKIKFLVISWMQLPKGWIVGSETFYDASFISTFVTGAKLLQYTTAAMFALNKRTTFESAEQMAIYLPTFVFAPERYNWKNMNLG